MDFEPAADAVAGHGRYESLATALLPPLVIAWRADAATIQARSTAICRDRFAGGDPVVRDVDVRAGAAARAGP